MPTLDELANMALETGADLGNGSAPESGRPGGAPAITPDLSGSTSGGVQVPAQPGPIGQNGFLDVMNGVNPPNVNKPGIPGFFFNIDDPDWAGKWSGPDPINLQLDPVQPDMSNPCMSNCERLAKLRESNCEQFRLRVAQAMATAGCPSIITPIPERKPCALGAGGVQVLPQTPACATCPYTPQQPVGVGCPMVRFS